MMDKKRRLFRLIEYYINEYKKDAVEEVYGKKSSIKIHSMSHSLSTNSLLFEVVIVLGESINEQTMDRELADILVQDALVWFFPEQSVKTYVRWDV